MGVWSRHPLAATLRASLYLGGFITSCEMIISWISGSTVLTLDGLYSIAETILSGIFVWSTWRLKNPEDKLPPQKLQHVLVRVQSLLMAGICIWAIGDGIHGLYHPQPSIRFDICFYFAAIALVMEVIMVRWIRSQANRLRSPLAAIEAYSWAMDAWLDLGFMISFFLGWWWQHIDAPWAQTGALYVNPVLTIGLGVLLLRKPIETLRMGANILLPRENKEQATSVESSPSPAHTPG